MAIAPKQTRLDACYFQLRIGRDSKDLLCAFAARISSVGVNVGLVLRSLW
jgi:hypothetical protein